MQLRCRGRSRATIGEVVVGLLAIMHVMTVVRVDGAEPAVVAVVAVVEVELLLDDVWTGGAEPVVVVFVVVELPLDAVPPVVPPTKAAIGGPGKVYGAPGLYTSGS
jgi:hypothetical protein